MQAPEDMQGKIKSCLDMYHALQGAEAKAVAAGDSVLSETTLFDTLGGYCKEGGASFRDALVQALGSDLHDFNGCLLLQGASALIPSGQASAPDPNLFLRSGPTELILAFLKQENLESIKRHFEGSSKLRMAYTQVFDAKPEQAIKALHSSIFSDMALSYSTSFLKSSDDVSKQGLKENILACFKERIAFCRNQEELQKTLESIQGKGAQLPSRAYTVLAQHRDKGLVSFFRAADAETTSVRAFKAMVLDKTKEGFNDQTTTRARANAVVERPSPK